MIEFSLLLGAGFSVNQGYPTAKQLNSKLAKLKPDDFWIDTSGNISLKDKEEEDPCWYTDYAKFKHFVVILIQFFIKMQDFNYEEFYDFYNRIFRKEVSNKKFQQLCDDFRSEYQIKTDNQNLLRHTDKIFNQLIALFLVDKNGNQFYKPIHYSKEVFEGYTGFLNCLEKWGNDGIAHVHSLNHDLFFEIFNSSDWFQGNLSDGFEELGSQYYGNLKEIYKVRLPFFTNNYNKKFRLYKLHGSVDQFPFYDKVNGLVNYIKVKPGIRTIDLFKEVKNEDNQLTYISDYSNYHSDFLSGTYSKILRYNDPVYYEKVFDHFQNNLTHSTSLIIIGYGCCDIEINNIIEKKFDYRNKPIFVVDPYPSDRTKQFLKRYNANLIIKNPNNIELNDFKEK